MTKLIKFLGTALDDLRAFPAPVRRETGYQLHKVQNGEMPADWKPMTTIARGVQEIRITDPTGAFRVVYIAKLADAIYVLHCFQKKTQKTSRADLDLAAKRCRSLMKERKP